MNQKKHYITTNQEILGGTPVITGTRIPIDVILYRLKEGHSVEELCRMYPWVSKKTLSGAIDEAIHLITTLHAKNVL